MSRRLLLTQNAQFYRVIEALSEETLRSILDAASSNQKPGSTLIADHFNKEEVLQDGSEYRFSLRVFATNRDVHFWSEPLNDTIYAFILLVTVDECLVVFKKSCASVSETIDKVATLIRSAELTAAFSDSDAQFQKMAMRNMTVSERAMRGKSYEAADLKGLLSTHAAGRSIPYFFKLRLNGRIKTISAQSGRVVEASERKSIEKIVEWAKGQIHQINNPSSDKDFLDAFAKLVELDVVWGKSEPTAILVESSFLVENVINKDIPILYTTRRGRAFQMTSKQIENLVSQLERVYEIAATEELDLIDSPRPARLKKNMSSISLTGRSLRQIKFDDNGKDITLQAYIKKYNLATITFADPRYMYFMGQCFEDGAGINEIPALLKSLVAFPELNAATSEKGRYTIKKTKYDTRSLFSIVEKIHRKDDYIFCDDLGDEWADHITFNKADSSVSFIHSKYGAVSKSASNLHDVVGQAIKNIGNMDIDPKTFLAKKYGEKFSTNYRGGAIPRIRKALPGIFHDYLTDLREDYRFNRRCIICCSFISKTLIEEEFKKIQDKKRVAGNVTQLFWILSSFMHAVREAGIRPIVYCRP